MIFANFFSKRKILLFLTANHKFFLFIHGKPTNDKIRIAQKFVYFTVSLLDSVGVQYSIHKFTTDIFNSVQLLLIRKVEMKNKSCTKSKISSICILLE